MVQLNVGLTEAVQSLQLSVAVERYKREDEEDESEDMSMMEECLERKFQQMEMHRQNDQRTMDENQADIMKALEVRLFCCRRSISDDVFVRPDRKGVQLIRRNVAIHQRFE